MELNAILIICIIALCVVFGFQIYTDKEPSTEMGTTLNLKPGIKVNDKYCYDVHSNKYVICL